MSAAHEDPHAHSSHGVAFEATDVATRPVLLSVLGLSVFTIVFTAIAWLVFQGLAAREHAASAPANPLAGEYAAKEPPAPRLQLHPKTDLDVLRAAEDKTLRSLAWIDKEKGIVQVPIERAMELYIAKGVPAREGPVPAKMQPKGVAPAQSGESAGAPDWMPGEQSGNPYRPHGDGHGAAPAHGAASHAPAHGDAPAHGGAAAPPSHGSAAAPPSHGSAAAPPSHGSAAPAAQGHEAGHEGHGH